MVSISSGVNDSATVTATPASYRMAGRQRSRRYGLTSELAEPKHTRITASCKPNTNAVMIDSSVTAPPMLTAAAHDGSGACGSVTSTWPGTPRWPKTISMATRITMTTSPIRRNRPSDRDHGPSPWQLATTKQATAPTSRRRKGLGSVVCMAVTARAAAQAHQARGCTGRRGRAPLTLRPAAAATGTRLPRRAARPESPPRRPAAADLPRTRCVPSRWSGRALPPAASTPVASARHPRSSWWTSSRCLRSAGSVRMHPGMGSSRTTPAPPTRALPRPMADPSLRWETS